MARTDNEIRVSTSVLDRLIDLEPRESREGPRSRTTSVSELKLSVLRDIEWLLNTRHGFDIPDGLEETNKSVVAFGLPDFTALSIANHNELAALTKDIKDAITFFEPRLLDLKIVFEPITNTERQIKFRIEARLDAEPHPEPITFDTVLNSGTGSFSVLES
jgi:type VI secretion system protein ImpF